MIVDIFMAMRVGLSNVDHRFINCGFEHSQDYMNYVSRSFLRMLRFRAYFVLC